MRRPAVLGLAGAYTDALSSIPSHYSTKVRGANAPSPPPSRSIYHAARSLIGMQVGGLPWLPGASLPPGSDDVTCLACGGQLSLVVQVG